MLGGQKYYIRRCEALSALIAISRVADNSWYSCRVRWSTHTFSRVLCGLPNRPNISNKNYHLSINRVLYSCFIIIFNVIKSSVDMIKYDIFNVWYEFLPHAVHRYVRFYIKEMLAKEFYLVIQLFDYFIQVNKTIKYIFKIKIKCNKIIILICNNM